MINRRDFLKQVMAASAGACCTAAFGNLGPKFAYAQSAGGSGKSLILFNQFGGNDPLNSFAIPFNVPEYRSTRPNIHIPTDMVLPIAGNQLGLHPVLSNLKRLFDAGDVAIIRGTGDPVGTRSHFSSQDIFSRGSTVDGDGKGWIGRLGDLYFENTSFNTIGIGVGSQLDFVSSRDSNIPLVLYSLENFRFDYGSVRGLDWEKENQHRQRVLRDLTALPAGNNTTLNSKVDSAQTLVQDSVSTIQAAFENFTPQGQYDETTPGSFFREITTTINHGLPTKVYYGGLGGWDHHSDQGSVEGSQAALLAQIDSALGAFEIDTKAQGKWNDVTTCIFTEFGRVTFENGSGGTDHGWGSAMVVIGGGVSGGLYGPATVGADFSAEWLPQVVDFRNPFSEMISWLGFNPGPVFPESFEKQNLGLLA